MRLNNTFVGLAFIPAFATFSIPCAAMTLSVKEIPESGRLDFSVCKDTTTSCVADYRSSLEITPGFGIETSIGTISTQTQSNERRAELIKALAAFTESMHLSAEIVSRCPPDSGKTAACDELSRDFNTQRSVLMNSLSQYTRLETPKDQPQIADAKAIRRMLAPAYEDPRKTGEWIAQRISILEMESEKASKDILARLQQTQIRMGAFHSRSSKQPTPLHLEGYDEFELKNIKPLDRISYALSNEQSKRLEEESRFNQALASEVKSLQDRSSTLLKRVKAQITNIRTSMTNAHKRLDLGLRELDVSTKDDIQALYADLRRSAAPNVQARLDEIEDQITFAQKRLTAYKEIADSARNELESLGRESNGRPDLALRSLLEAAEKLHSDLNAKTASDLIAAGAALNKVKNAIVALKAEGSSLNQTALARVSEIEGRKTGTLLKILEDVEGILRSEVEVQYALLDDFRIRVEKYVDGAGPILAADLSDPGIYTVTGDKAGATILDLSTTGVDSGDEIELLLEVVDPSKSGQSRKLRRRIRIERFGWSSNVVGGLAFVKSELTSQANFEPAPTITWLISRTSRPEERGISALLGRMRPSVGIHTIGLDFDPNNSVEVGMGVSLHFFKDILQLGYGMNLNIPQKRQYGFVGLRLFGMLNK